MRSTRTKFTITAIITVTFLSTVALRPNKRGRFARKPQALPLRPTRAAATESAERERILLDRIEKLERRLAELELRSESMTGREPLPVATHSGAQPAERLVKNEPATTALEPRANHQEDRDVLGSLRDTTINVTVDGYYDCH